MPANETAEAVSRSVTELGRRVGLDAQEFNVGLFLAGLLGGEPGAWWFTEQGKQLATAHLHHNGYGGHAARYWDITTWPETVTEKLDLSEEGIARIRQFITDRNWPSRRSSRPRGRRPTRRSWPPKPPSTPPTLRPTSPAQLAPGSSWGSAWPSSPATGSKARPRVWRWWKERAGAPEQARDDGDRGAPPEGLK